MMDFLKCIRTFTIVLSLMLELIVLQSNAQERTIQNPGYVELATCACNVKGDLCDFNCCCDTDCSTTEQARFESCIPGLFGGQGGNTEAYKCGTSEFNTPDWHRLICVYWENNAYLGMFFMNKAKFATQDAVTTAATLYTQNRYSLSETERRYVDKDFAATIYTQGIILTTLRPDIASGQPAYSGLLSLPQQINSGQCNPLAPVRFLKPFQSSCQSSLTISTCAALSTFDANTYLLSSTINTGFQITSALKGTVRAESEVRYYCTTQNNNYLPSTTTSLEDIASNTASSFPATLQTADCTEPCSDVTCTQYNTDRSYTSVYDTTLPARCAFDDGNTAPPVPNMNVATCQNVVLEVRYSFQWAGSVIQKLTADVVLGNIGSVTAQATKLAQRYSVSWTHQINTTLTTSTVDDNYTNTTQPYQRSGMAGYDPVKPLASGCTSSTVINTTQPVNIVAQRQMAIFRPGVDGLCATSQRESLLFGQDVMSSCALRLTYSQLVDCESLRTLVMNHLNVLMPSDVIGRYGYNDVTNQDMWISVLRQNLTEIFSSDAALPIPTFTGNETAFRLADYVAGRCLLPTAVNLRILYAQTGAINYHPLYEVIGAYVNYTVSNWTMTCMGSNSQRCTTTSTQVENFFLESTVQFIKVPAIPPTPQDSFYTKIDPETCDSASCDRYFSFWATDLCYYDSCWQQIAYPLTDAYDADTHEYTLAIFLTLVLGVVGYTSVAKPGWS